MSKWYSVVIYNEKPLQAPLMGLFIMPTTKDHPKNPVPGGHMLGGVKNSRLQAIEDAIAYLQAEKLVAEADILSNARRKGFHQ